ncbi:mannose-6-phosphate isomerase [Bacillus mycoides KBAB4]|nr:mannose-6-phosphate isomerase, class I [Bacillus cereus]CAH2464471.1 mannose-6-phosphate isomerase [Bacillus mycoides KBAB4]
MKIFVFYISEYGFGHATRCIALIREMLRARNDVQIIVCNSFALQFIRASLIEYEDRIIFHDVETDVGFVLKENSLELDKEKLKQAYVSFCADLPRKIGEELSFLESFTVDCIISDIAPIAFEVADRLEVPSIGISNFSWYTAYKNVLSVNLLQVFKDMYKKMDYFYTLAGSNEPQWARIDTFSFNFYSRKINSLEVEKIKLKLNPTGKKQIVFIPIGMKIDIGNITSLPLWDEERFIFIVSHNMKIEHENVFKIPQNYTESQNYVAAADCIISKAGWGTVSEAVLQNKLLLIIDRKEMSEDQHTIQFLRGNNLCGLITWEELQYMNIEEHIKVPRVIYENEAQKITSHIFKLTTAQLLIGKKDYKRMQSPLFLQPVLQERIWGGKSLKKFNYDLSSESIGECWGISAHPNGMSIVKEGPYKGVTLEQLWREERYLFGECLSEKFPLLTKMLDANKDLSVQVHPDDEFAHTYENGELGKTECWYIVDCKEDAQLVYGHNADTKVDFEEMIKEGKWEDLLRRVSIKPGDFFYVPSGTIHALCEGTVVLETQQSSDTTYRVYDYERIDANGNKRELHLDKAIQVANIPHEDYQVRPKIIEENGVFITTYVREKYFSVYKWEIKERASFQQREIFQLVSVIEGEGTLTTIDGDFSIKKGDHFILPITIENFSIKGNVTTIVSHP